MSPSTVHPRPVIIWCFEKRSQNIDSPLSKPPLTLLALSLSSVGRSILVTRPLLPLLPPLAILQTLSYLDSELLSHAPSLWGSFPTSPDINVKPNATASTSCLAVPLGLHSTAKEVYRLGPFFCYLNIPGVELLWVGWWAGEKKNPLAVIQNLPQAP